MSGEAARGCVGADAAAALELDGELQWALRGSVHRTELAVCGAVGLGGGDPLAAAHRALDHRAGPLRDVSRVLHMEHVFDGQDCSINGVVGPRLPCTSYL